jgi:hypothetical protein
MKDLEEETHLNHPFRTPKSFYFLILSIILGDFGDIIAQQTNLICMYEQKTPLTLVDSL